MRRTFPDWAIVALVWAACGCSPAVAQTAKPPPQHAAGSAAGDTRQFLNNAALTRRIEEYSDTRKGEDRAAEDRRAREVAQRFVAALVRKDPEGMAAVSTSPWVDGAELIREDAARRSRLAAYRVPGALARGEQRIALLTGLEELEQALGERVPDSGRKTWVSHLTAGSRIAIVQRGPMLLGLALRRTGAEYSVSGLLFDYFPTPGDPLLRVFTGALIDPH